MSEPKPPPPNDTDKLETLADQTRRAVAETSGMYAPELAVEGVSLSEQLRRGIEQQIARAREHAEWSIAKRHGLTLDGDIRTALESRPLTIEQQEQIIREWREDMSRIADTYAPMLAMLPPAPVYLNVADADFLPVRERDILWGSTTVSGDLAKALTSKKSNDEV